MTTPYVPKWTHRYRGATVEDLDPPAALSLPTTAPISTALLTSFENDYTHLTVVTPRTRSLVGYISIPALQAQLAAGKLRPEQLLVEAMTRFSRKKGTYMLITKETPLEKLEEFFYAGGDQDGDDKEREGREFAVVTDEKRKFVVGVATREDLKRFMESRPE